MALGILACLGALDKTMRLTSKHPVVEPSICFRFDTLRAPLIQYISTLGYVMRK